MASRSKMHDISFFNLAESARARIQTERIFEILKRFLRCSTPELVYSVGDSLQCDCQVFVRIGNVATVCKDIATSFIEGPPHSTSLSPQPPCLLQPSTILNSNFICSVVLEPLGSPCTRTFLRAAFTSSGTGEAVDSKDKQDSIEETSYRYRT